MSELSPRSGDAPTSYRNIVELSERDSRLIQTLIDALGSNTVVLGPDRTILFVNKAWRQLATRSGSIGREYGTGGKYPDALASLAWISWSDSSAIRHGVQRIIRNEEVDFQLEYQCNAFAEPSWSLVRATSFCLPGSSHRRYILISHDDISRSRSVPNKDLADLGGRLINAQEEERKRIARELHDDVNQRVALIAIELEQLAQQSPDGPSGLKVRLNGIQSRVSEMSREIHRMSYELHPSKLEHLGLAPALNSFCIDLAASRKIDIAFEHGPVPATLPREVTLCIFRIAQEALHNAAKYSGVEKVIVTLGVTGSSISLKVTDRGLGFDTNSEKFTKGLGLTSMQERARLVGGRLRIKSEVGGGTTIEATVPLIQIG